MARDDGRGSSEIKAGNGLTGMRERLEVFGGSLDIETRPGYGFVVLARQKQYVPMISVDWK